MIRAAGVIFITYDKKILLLKRNGDYVDHGNEWAYPGGRIGEGEDAEDAAYRECFEEVGVWAVRMQEFTRSEKDGVEYTTFLMLGSEFQPLMNIEHKTSKWVSLDKALTMKLHPRARETIELLAKAIKEQEES